MKTDIVREIWSHGGQSMGKHKPVPAGNTEAQHVPSQVRKARVRDLLMKKETVSIAELASVFNVSEMTIRRDLDNLEREGELRRVHGGAMANERITFESHFQQRRKTHHKQKKAIAHEAARLILPNQSIILDNGTTALELALEIKDRDKLTLITPSLAVASVMQYSEGVHTILLGGSLRRGQPDLTGGVTEFTLDLFAVDLVFQGADGIDAEGWIYNEEVQLARVDQKMRERATTSWIVADSSKLGHAALVRNGHLSEVAGLITDDGIAPELLNAWRDKGINVVVVKVSARTGADTSDTLSTDDE